MGDMGDFWYDINCLRAAQKTKNKKRNTLALEQSGIAFNSFNNGFHLRFMSYDYYPSTDLYIHRNTGKKGWGLIKLLKQIKRGS